MRDHRYQRFADAIRTDYADPLNRCVSCVGVWKCHVGVDRVGLAGSVCGPVVTTVVLCVGLNARI